MISISFMNKCGKEQEALAGNMMQSNCELSEENDAWQFSSMAQGGLNCKTASIKHPHDLGSATSHWKPSKLSASDPLFGYGP